MRAPLAGWDEPGPCFECVCVCVRMCVFVCVQTFEMGIVGKRARLLINPAVISTLSGSWPELQRLALACMVPPEPLMEGGKPTGQFKGPLQPAALTLLGGYHVCQHTHTHTHVPDVTSVKF